MAAVRCRARHEFGLDVKGVRVALADFRYRAEHDGGVENEICPVYVGRPSVVPDGCRWPGTCVPSRSRWWR